MEGAAKITLKRGMEWKNSGRLNNLPQNEVGTTSMPRRNTHLKLDIILENSMVDHRVMTFLKEI